jgi:Fe2+ or Zn2+ uptake regulation protein
MGARQKARFALNTPLSPEDIEAGCRARGIRIGPQRRAVARALAEIPGPFDFDRVLEEVRRVAPQISRGTVYLSLRRFRSAGLLRGPLAAGQDTYRPEFPSGDSA